MPSPWDPALTVHEIQPVADDLPRQLSIPLVHHQLVKALIPQKTSGEEAPAGGSSEQGISPVVDNQRVRASWLGSLLGVGLGTGWKLHLQEEGPESGCQQCL